MYTQSHFKGGYYAYTSTDTDYYICMNLNSLEAGDGIYSIRQREPQGKHIRCQFFADYDCISDRGEATAEGNWDFPRLKDNVREYQKAKLGDWENQILSVQCFWIQPDARPTKNTGLQVRDLAIRDETDVVSITTYHFGENLIDIRSSCT